MHKLLARLLRKHAPEIPPGLQPLLEAVDEALQAADMDRAMIERSMDLASKDLLEANRRLRSELESRRLAEAQLRQAQKMEAVGRLAGGVAHDFNNILTVINGYSELLKAQTPDSDPRHPEIEEIRRAALRASDLTRQLLAFSRRQVLQVRVFELDALVVELERMLGRLIGEDIELITELDAAGACIKADPGQVQQVIMNLVVNARDAMPSGGRIILRTTVLPDPAVQLTVTDTGCGMDEETFAHLFEPFFTTKGVGKGTGLGLSMVYGIVQQSGGRISVDTAPGRGTKFRIVLPMAPGEDSSTRVRRLGPASLGSETILLVEDEPGVRKLVGSLLKARGYRVIEAGDGSRALELFENHPGPVHLLLTDVVMPGMNGLELAERASVRRPEARVLFMSGYTDDDRVQGVTADGRGFIQKPFTLDALARKVREILDLPAVS